MTLSNTETVYVGDKRDEVPELVAPLMEQLRKAGIEIDRSKVFYQRVRIEFPSTFELERFLNIISEYEEGFDSLYRRICGEDQNVYLKGWRYELIPVHIGRDKVSSFAMCCEVQFSVAELPILVQCFKAFNDGGGDTASATSTWHLRYPQVR